MQKPLFDTKVQELKYKVLKSVAKKAFEGNLESCYYDIPLEIVKGGEATMRCCIYKERAIVQERVKLAKGGDIENPNVIEVIPIACDECPVSSYTVTMSCRGCIAHRCASACPKDAISFDNHKAIIDTDKCIKCGKCAAVCPYSAITETKRPCEVACKVKAISSSPEEKWAHIDNEKCIACGACVYQCPFGAVADKSFILEAIEIIKKSESNTKYNTYAVVAPSIASQYTHMPLGQVVAGIKKLGFKNVVEAALGADMVAFKESVELKEKGFLTSSCCPAFVSYIEKNFPKLKENISHNLSPMAEVAKFIKNIDPTSKIVFIGPCTAKKMEFQKKSVAPYIDCVITFEEFQALIDSREIDMTVLKEEPLDNASYYGRIFARSGGLSDAVVQAAKEQGLDSDGFEVKAAVCDGIELCKTALLKANKGVLPENFIEGMICSGGCIGGAGCMTHGVKDKNEVDKYGKEALEKTIKDAIRVYQMENN
ncbi:MAG: 4Fe-4S dicluster domain-containing protein [Oscillospiraceae bacterium]